MSIGFVRFQAMDHRGVRMIIHLHVAAFCLARTQLGIKSLSVEFRFPVAGRAKFEDLFVEE